MTYQNYAGNKSYQASQLFYQKENRVTFLAKAKQVYSLFLTTQNKLPEIKFIARKTLINIKGRLNSKI